MKALHQFFNTDKAALLFDLFPQEIPKLLTGINSYCDYIISNEETHRKEWGFGLFTFDYWLQLAKNTQDILNTGSENLAKRRRCFCDQLFEMPVVMFVIDATVKYAERHCDNKKFTAMVAILFHA